MPPPIREWAKQNGFVVGTRGRFSKELLDAYSNAFPDAPTKSSDIAVTKVYEPIVTPPTVHPEWKGGLWARAGDGIRFVFSICSKCTLNVTRCTCKIPHPPKSNNPLHDSVLDDDRLINA